MAAARSFAMAFNRLADRHIDATNPRTDARHLPAGILSVWQVTAFTAIFALVFIASTLLFLPNPLPLYFSVPVLAFLAGYSFTKRFTMLAHFWLGTSLALSPVAAWIWRFAVKLSLRNPATYYRRSCWVLPFSLGSLASTSSMPARITTSTSPPGISASRPASEFHSAALPRRRMPSANGFVSGLPAVGVSVVWLGVLAGDRRGRNSTRLRAFACASR